MKGKPQKSDKSKKEDKKHLKSKNNKQLIQLYRTGLRGYALADPPTGHKFEK